MSLAGIVAGLCVGAVVLYVIDRNNDIRDRVAARLHKPSPAVIPFWTD